jgi:hypothetical protein
VFVKRHDKLHSGPVDWKFIDCSGPEVAALTAELRPDWAGISVIPNDENVGVGLFDADRLVGYVLAIKTNLGHELHQALVPSLRRGRGLFLFLQRAGRYIFESVDEVYVQAKGTPEDRIAGHCARFFDFDCDYPEDAPPIARMTSQRWFALWG